MTKVDNELPILKPAPTRAEIINALNLLKDAMKEARDPGNEWAFNQHLRYLAEWFELDYEVKK